MHEIYTNATHDEIHFRVYFYTDGFILE